MIPHAAAHDLGVDFSPAEGVEVRAYGGALLPILGVIRNDKIAFGERSHESRVRITRDLFRPILGMNFLHDLGVVTNLQCAPITCFDNHFSAGFRLKTNVSTDGLCFPARLLPFSMKIPVENELQRLLQNNVICEQRRLVPTLRSIIRCLVATNDVLLYLMVISTAARLQSGQSVTD